MIHPDGCYFGMAPEEYHDDPALGGTSHKDMLMNPVQAQWKRLRQLREELGMGPVKRRTDDGKDEETVAQAFGTAVHTICLEGRAVFDERYAVAPDRPEGMLTTREAMRDALGDRCTLPRSASSYDHKVLCKVYGVGPLEDDWELAKTTALLGRTEISKRWASTFNLIDKMLDMKRASRGGMSIREKVLVKGQPEVSVFWTDDTGLRLKARFDYLRVGSTVDLKTFAAREGREIVDAFAYAVQTYAYDMQAAHYQDARSQLGNLERFDCPDEGWLNAVVANNNPAWVWLAVQTMGMPEIDTLEFPQELVFASARVQVERARQNCRDYAALFGDDQPWVADRPSILMSDQVFNSSITGRGDSRWTA